MRTHFQLWLTLFVAGSLLLSFTGCRPSHSSPAPVAHQGHIDLSHWDFQNNGPLKLDGEWEVFQNQLLTEVETNDDSRQYTQVPTREQTTEEQEDWRCATYRLQLSALPDQKLALSVKHVSTAFRLLIDGEVVLTNGQVGCEPGTSLPDYTSRLYFLEGPAEHLEILLQVSNFHARYGGIPHSLTLGPSENMVALQSRRVALDAILFGALLIIALYHWIVYQVRDKDKSLFFFGMVALANGVRALLTGERLLYSLLSPEYWTLLFRVDYLTFTASNFFFILYIHELFPREYPRWQVWTITVPSFLYSVIILLTPTRFFTEYVFIFQVITAVGLIYVLVGLVLIILRRRENAWLFAAGFFALVLGVTSDLLYNNGIVLINSDNMSMVGLFLFFFAQSALLAARFSRAFHRIEDLTVELRQAVEVQVRLNQAIKRFVPVQFLQELGKEDYSDIKMGDSTAKKMTVLFSDLRSFTQLSESLSPEENFRFLNSYLSRMEPYIQANGGFVDKYIGDAIMALFRDWQGNTSADAAVKTTLALREELQAFNQDRRRNHYPPIDFGIGINTGDLMLGTVGSVNRLDTTVIGDTVNLAARLEALTKYFRIPVLLSDFTYQALNHPETYRFRKIDVVKVPGKERSVTIYELITPEEPRTADLKMDTLSEFYQAIDLYADRRFEEALRLFQHILRQNPEDSVAAIYRDRCQGYVDSPPPEHWSGVVHIQYK